MGFQFHKASPKADYADDIRMALGELFPKRDPRDFELPSLCHLTAKDIYTFVEVLSALSARRFNDDQG
jgi:hypothetical protein